MPLLATIKISLIVERMSNFAFLIYRTRRSTAALLPPKAKEFERAE